MDAISKIKNEIESLHIDANKLCEKNRYVNESAHQYYGGKRDGYRVSLRIIESLEKETPKIKGWMTREEIIRCARLLQYSSNPKELAQFISEIADEEMEYPIEPKGLDEAAAKYANRGISSSADPFDEIKEYQKDKDAFKAGAKWMAEQGVTVEGIARPDDCEVWVNLTGQGFKNGDKVIVQIRKKV